MDTSFANGYSMKIVIPATIVACAAIAWFCIAMWYTYINIGSSDSFNAFSKQLASILGVSLLSCIALIIGLALLSIQWSSLQNSAYLAIGISTVALACSSAAMTIASLTH